MKQRLSEIVLALSCYENLAFGALVRFCLRESFNAGIAWLASGLMNSKAYDRAGSFFSNAALHCR